MASHGDLEHIIHKVDTDFSLDSNDHKGLQMASNGKGSINSHAETCNSLNHSEGGEVNKPKISSSVNNGGNDVSSEKEKNGLHKDVITEEIARKKAYRWCRDSIGGDWAKLKSDEFIISHVSGGMTNYLYLISLPPAVAKNSSEPTEVLLRIYGEISKSTMDFLIHNSVVFALLAEKRLGPIPYGMYHDGRIEEFIKADPLPPTDLQRPEVMSMVASKLAKFHNLKMPLCKKPAFFKNLVRGWLKDVVSNHSSCSQVLSAINQIAPPSFDIHSEFQELLTIASDLQAPVVFCHNDLQGGNVLLAPEGSPAKDKMTIIDWEYGHYNYRGFDLGNHFNEWMLDYSSPGKPGFVCTPEHFPRKEQQYMFFRSYLEALNEGEVTEDSLYTLFKETNTLAMHSHFLWGVWSIVQFLTSSIDFDYSAYSLCRFQEYFRLKERLPTLFERSSS